MSVKNALTVLAPSLVADADWADALSHRSQTEAKTSINCFVEAVIDPVSEVYVTIADRIVVIRQFRHVLAFAAGGYPLGMGTVPIHLRVEYGKMAKPLTNS